jgi:opacity protein-like surface antigen
VGIRLTRNLGLDLEVLHVHDLSFSGDDLFIIQRVGVPEILFAPPFSFTREGNVTAFMTKLTAEFPVAGDRLIPFLTGGGGVGRVAERIGFRCSGACPAILFPEVEQAETGLALTVGGGVDVRLWQGLAVGGEVRWFRLLLNQRDLDFAHVAGRVSYRF